LDSRNNVRRCNAVTAVALSGAKFPILNMERRDLTPLCTLPGILKDHSGDLALDFDESMGRIVHCDEVGLVSVVDVA
jgi:hypothetical protein